MVENGDQLNENLRRETIFLAATLLIIVLNVAKCNLG